MDNESRQKLLNHLAMRPIGPIVEGSVEKQFDIALKVMTVIDYFAETHSIYPEVNQTPKLLYQLMQFRYFGSGFRFIEYKLKRVLVLKKLLKCEVCEFIGPYMRTLEHMVLSHDRHAAGAKCRFCMKTSLKDHELNNTFETCYMHYRIREQINSNYQCPTVIDEFYTLIKKVATKWGVVTQRSDVFKASESKKASCVVDLCNGNDDDDEVQAINSPVYMRSSNVYMTKKSINVRVLDTMFREAVIYFKIPIDVPIPVETVMNTPNDPSQRVFTIPDHIGTTPYYGDNSSANSSSPYNYYSSPMNTGMSSDMSSKLFPRMVQSVVYSPPYTVTPPHVNDNMTSPVQMHGMNSNTGTNTTNGNMISPMVGANMSETNASNNNNDSNVTQEMITFANFIASTLTNMQHESVRRKAKFQIQQLILKLSAEDMNLQFPNGQM